MNDTDIQTLNAGNPIIWKWDKLHAAKLGPFPVRVRIHVRAFSTHSGGSTSTASTKLYYDGALVGETSGQGLPLDRDVDYSVALDDGNSAAFRLDVTNRLATIVNYGFEFTLTLV